MKLLTIPFASVGAADIIDAVAAGLSENLRLDYKREPYAGNDDGRKELLRDICMFANASGGMLIIGVDEVRDEEGKPTGTPSATDIGVSIDNPEKLLDAYAAAVESCISERLLVQTKAVPIADGRYVLLISVPNSTRKPHMVTFKGSIYLSGRRERSRYPLSIREVKDMVMRTQAQRSDAEQALRGFIERFDSIQDRPFQIRAAISPLFFSEYSVDLTRGSVASWIDKLCRYGERPSSGFGAYTADGLGKDLGNGHVVTVSRSGAVFLRMAMRGGRRETVPQFYPKAFDPAIVQFARQCGELFNSYPIGGPFLLAASFKSSIAHETAYTEWDFGETWKEPCTLVMPAIEVDDLIHPESQIKPLLDSFHQAWGKRSSPFFTDAGEWNAPPH